MKYFRRKFAELLVSTQAFWGLEGLDNYFRAHVHSACQRSWDIPSKLSLAVRDTIGL